MRHIAPSRRRADEFAAAVDGRATSQGLSEETVAFLALVQQLRDLDGPVLSEEFSSELRAGLMVAAETELVNEQRPATARAAATTAYDVKRRRALSLAATACIIAGAGTGVAAASQSALPGDALYPVKRGIERVELSLARGDADRGNELLDQADTRLTEIRDLSVTEADDPAAPALIGDALDDFTSQATEGGDLMISSFEQQSDEQAIVDLRAFTSSAATQLSDLSDAVSPDLRPDLVAAAETLTRLDARAVDACATCSSLAPLTLSSALVTLRQQAASLGDASGNGTLRDAPARPDNTAPADRPEQQPPGGLVTLPADLPTIPSGGLPNSPSQTQGGQSTQEVPQPSSGGTTNAPPAVPDPTVATGAPGLPLPTVDLEDPLDTVPDVLDTVPDVLDGVPEVLDPADDLLQNPPMAP